MFKSALKLRRAAHQEAGFTLIELMISLTVVSVAIAAAFTMAFSLMNGFKTSRASVQTESTARTVLDIIANGVRAASPGLPSGVLWDPCTGANIDTITVTNSSTAPDELRMIHALGGAVAFINTTQTVLPASLAVASNDLFEKDLWIPAVIVDPLQAKGHLVDIKATGTNVNEILTRNPGACATGAGGVGATSYGPGSFIVRAINVHYYVSPPFLMVNPDARGTDAEIMADGIEDMQIAIGIENGTDTSTLTDSNDATDEWIYNASTDAAAGSVSVGDWRALRVTIVGYSRTEQSEATDRLRPGAEDRAISSTGDSFRRRTFSSTVNVRSFASGN